MSRHICQVSRQPRHICQLSVKYPGTSPVSKDNQQTSANCQINVKAHLSNVKTTNKDLPTARLLSRHICQMSRQPRHICQLSSQNCQLSRHICQLSRYNCQTASYKEPPCSQNIQPLFSIWAGPLVQMVLKQLRKALFDIIPLPLILPIHSGN
jgi:hypothetical protein